MTNFERIKQMRVQDVFEFMGFEESIQQRVFLNIFQLINCRYCPAKQKCSNGCGCQQTQKQWLENENNP
jgi:hypothetical protein